MIDFDLQEETDFVEFVREIIFNRSEKIFVRTHNFTGDKEKLSGRLKILRADFFSQTKIFCVRPEKFSRVELCMAGENFRDVFVTAPTGAGKSVIFQVPAIYLAENYGLLTPVISPLIGLMTDQVNNLTLKNITTPERLTRTFPHCSRTTSPATLRRAHATYMIDDGESYSNEILEEVAFRHKISVAMLTYIYEGNFSNEKIWDLPEDYFLGKIPDVVMKNIS